MCAIRSVVTKLGIGGTAELGREVVVAQARVILGKSPPDGRRPTTMASGMTPSAESRLTHSSAAQSTPLMGLVRGSKTLAPSFRTMRGKSPGQVGAVAVGQPDQDITRTSQNAGVNAFVSQPTHGSDLSNQPPCDEESLPARRNGRNCPAHRHGHPPTPAPRSPDGSCIQNRNPSRRSTVADMIGRLPLQTEAFLGFPMTQDRAGCRRQNRLVRMANGGRIWKRMLLMVGLLHLTTEDAPSTELFVKC